MTSRNHAILNLFPKEMSWEDKYKIIIKLGKQLPALPECDKTEKWLIKACQAPLWLKARQNSLNQLIFTGDSEALITKGLLALIIQFYQAKTAQEIQADPIIFIKELKLDQYLSFKRTNGIQTLLDQILLYSRAFLAISQLQSKKNT